MDSHKTDEESHDNESRPLLPLPTSELESQRVSKASLKIRWIVLVLACLLMIGNYYCFDNPEALSEQLKHEFADTTYGAQWQTWYGLFYSVYSFPNVILPIFGGFFVDKFGVKLMLMLFAGFIVTGQLIFALGGSIKSVPLMLAGRVVFGFGGENLTVAQSTLISMWFKNKELAFAQGVGLSLARLGSVANNFMSPYFWHQAQFSLWAGAIICGASFACTVLLVPIDARASSTIKRLNEAKGLDELKVDVDDPVKLSDILKFKTPFWLLTFSCIVVYGTVIPFNSIAGSFFQHRDFVNTDTAFPWVGNKTATTNRTYIIPDSGCDKTGSDIPFPAHPTGLCSRNDTFHLGVEYANAQFIKTATNDVDVVDATCIDGFKKTTKQSWEEVGPNGNVVVRQVGASDYFGQADTLTIAAKCDTKTGMWALVTNGNGTQVTNAYCAPATTTCHADGPNSREAQVLQVANTTKWPTKSGASVQTTCHVGSKVQDKYCVSTGDGCQKSSAKISVTCGDDGLFRYTNPGTYCANQLYQPEAYCTQFNKAVTSSAEMVSIPYLISACISPFLGFFVDMCGLRAVMATLAPLVLFGVHASLGLTDMYPLAPMVAQGLAYSVFAAALWPSVPYVVEEKSIGSAYGLLTAVQNGGLALFPIIIGTILDPCNYDPPTTPDHIQSDAAHAECVASLDNYHYSEYFFMGLAAFGFCIGVWLNIDDTANRGRQLNKVHYAKSASDDVEDGRPIN